MKWQREQPTGLGPPLLCCVIYVNKLTKKNRTNLRRPGKSTRPIHAIRRYPRLSFFPVTHCRRLDFLRPETRTRVRSLLLLDAFLHAIMHLYDNFNPLENCCITVTIAVTGIPSLLRSCRDQPAVQLVSTISKALRALPPALTQTDCLVRLSWPSRLPACRRSPSVIICRAHLYKYAKNLRHDNAIATHGQLFYCHHSRATCWC